MSIELETRKLQALADRAAAIYCDAYWEAITENRTDDEAHEDAVWALKEEGIAYREDYEPGVYVKDHQMCAWTWDPDDIGATDYAWGAIHAYAPLDLTI